MERAGLLFLVLLFSSLSRGELRDTDIAEQRKSSPESVNVPEQPQPCPSDLHAVLRDMSAKLARHEERIEQLQKLNQDQETKLREQLQDQETKLREELQAQAVELANMKIWSNAELTSIKTSANATENHVESLRRYRAVRQVAFSAGLLASGGGFIGPFNTHTPLVFRRVISNIGNAYNPNTGFFIAPVRGAYHFELYTGSYSSDYHTSGVYLVKNGEHVVLSYERGPNGHSSAANGATLLLEPGDVVFPRLLSNSNIFDSTNSHSTFSGHLLFPM